MQISKLYNSILTKIGGIDKTAHFAIYGLVVALCSLYGIKCMIFGWIIMFILSFIKELICDTTFDKKDIIAGIIGGTISAINCIIFNIIK